MSSDASCENPEAFSWRRVLKDRTCRTIALALLLIVGMGLMRPDKPAGMYPKKYWANKIGWRHCADAVLTGDSRTLMALSPAEMKKEIWENLGIRKWYRRDEPGFDIHQHVSADALNRAANRGYKRAYP